MTTVFDNVQDIDNILGKTVYVVEKYYTNDIGVKRLIITKENFFSIYDNDKNENNVFDSIDEINLEDFI